MLLKLWLKTLLYRLRGWCPPTEILVRQGMTVGRNFKRLNDVIWDPGHCWLIEIGDNVTLAPRVHILCHDASTKNALGYAKVGGGVNIGDNVFIGADSVVLPGSRIGSDVVVGAKSTICGDIPNGVVVAGCPARVICSHSDYLARMRAAMDGNAAVWGEAYTLRGGITEAHKAEMRSALKKTRIGFVK